ncbi:MAG: hypothetical protein AYL28_001050 [Candidatus Bathyarchaeota archaeon B23]|nr:MAG: hypothetical protein AYL28_001050 [Candidatus Bathyarchaeota archaeon B23]
MDVNLLRRLSEAYGPPGYEEEVREILREELEGYADEVEEDKLGNIFFRRGGEGPLVMLAAHMDEVGILITHIEEGGFLRFHPLGGIADRILPGQRFRLRGRRGEVKGIVGTRPPHIMKEEERKKVVPRENLFIDVGAGSGEEAEGKGCHIGMTGVFDTPFEELGDGYVRGKAFDDRAGCSVLVEAFKRLCEADVNVVAVGTVQEEVGLRGARTAAWQLEPDYALALEGTFAADVPGSKPHQVSARLRHGPVITIVDRATITHPKVLRILLEAAEGEGIPHQFKEMPMGGTDAGAIHLTKGGVPSGTVAVPCRYIHGPAAVAHLEDFENTLKLVEAFVRHISMD